MDWHHKVDLASLYVPLERCISVNFGYLDPTAIGKLLTNDYDQAPVFNSEGEAVGIVETDYLERLLASGHPLNENTAELDSASINSEASLDTLLDVLSSSRSKLVRLASTPVGLITISDLNKPPLRSLIYPLLARLEIDLAALIADTCHDPWSWIPLLSKQRQVQVLGYWELTKRSGVDTGPLTGCMLTDLIEILAKMDSVRALAGYADAGAVRLSLGGVPKFRNKVMPPVSPLVLSIADVAAAREVLNRVVELGERLEKAPRND